MLLTNLGNSFIKILLLALLFFVSACGSDPYLYDRTGFDQDARPVVAPNPNAPRTVAPDYYHQQQYPAYQQQYGYQPSYQQPQYQQVPTYPQYPSGGGGSRYYSNPYAIPPSNGYYQRYDVDQYYIPPTYYNNLNDQQMRSTGYN